MADVADETAWGDVVALCDGRIDTLVSNAFVVDVHEAATLTLDSWQRQLAVNLTGAFLGVRSCLPDLRQSGMPGGGRWFWFRPCTPAPVSRAIRPTQPPRAG